MRVWAGGSATGTPVQELTGAATSGTWSVTATGLAAGTYTLQATQSDAAGNVGRSQTVTVTNDGAVAHTVTGIGSATFDSGTLAPGRTFSFIAEGKGTISYVCTIHAGMKGTIEID